MQKEQHWHDNKYNIKAAEFQLVGSISSTAGAWLHSNKKWKYHEKIKITPTPKTPGNKPSKKHKTSSRLLCFFSSSADSSAEAEKC